jgi:hypothetical protein
MYWLWKRKQAGTVSDAAVAGAQAKGKGSSEGSSDTASQVRGSHRVTQCHAVLRCDLLKSQATLS